MHGASLLRVQAAASDSGTEQDAELGGPQFFAQPGFHELSCEAWRALPGRNCLTIMGRLGTDITSRQYGNGKTMYKGRMVTTEEAPAPGTPPEFDGQWFEFVVWDSLKDLGDEMERCWRKGNMVAVSGNVRQESYTSNAGEARSSFAITVDNVANVVNGPRGRKREEGQEQY
eukprot:CAMPEP_0119101056 /NCGR_PEP_ID=MMETSP1180-20130426/192_1 /TAXON_ID=3052 ORGANISM="Chlamydomonas cf sp, Strain CCMP681" /NCGR_SAMPLE_ID=MMETSP1180 /ASSEMBLY_ACC=CAM_ASM_000741 /LENGTH=171 /DNA_ID=CAMNT_0007085095 /DNA_START=208 /DNA_END=723 /DNA_ORIENTATION=+